MRRRTVRLATIAVVLGGVLVLGAGAAQAHPLGNFTINLYDGLTVGPHGIDVAAKAADIRPGKSYAGEPRDDLSIDAVVEAKPLAVGVDAAAGSRSPSKAPSSPCGPRPPAPGPPPGAGGLSTQLECSCTQTPRSTPAPGSRSATTPIPDGSAGTRSRPPASA
jgi:hypothetical protein